MTREFKTLGVYRAVCVVLAGEGSRAVKYFDDKIQQSPKGQDEEIIADESQMMFLIASLIKDKED